MGRHHLSVSANIAAPVDVVWALLADHRHYCEWAAMSSSSLEREGSPEPDGVGAIRVLGTANVLSREQIVEFDPPDHLAYTLLSGLPISNYRSDVTLTDHPGPRTLLTWASSYDARVGTGWPMKLFLQFVRGDFARRLSRAAVRAAR